MSRRRDGGYVLVMALLVTGLMFATGLAVLSRATAEVTLGRSAQEYEQAWQTAVAGIEHCIGHVRHTAEGRDLMAALANHPVVDTEVCTQSFANDRMQYQVQALSTNGRQMSIRSVGSAGRHTRTVATIVDYNRGSGGGKMLKAWGGGPIRFSGGTVIGEIYSAAHITLLGQVALCGNFYAREYVDPQSVKPTTGCDVGYHYPFPPVKFPEFGLEQMKTRFGLKYEGNHSPSCPDNGVRDPDCTGPAGSELIVWVTGDLHLQGATKYYRGRVIYVVDGNIILQSDIETEADTLLQFSITGADKRIEKMGNRTLRGVFVAPEGTFYTPGNGTVHGLVFAKQLWDNDGTLTWVADHSRGFCTNEECYGGRATMVKLWEE